MRRRKTALLKLLEPQPPELLSYNEPGNSGTSRQSGYWDDPATWGGFTVPAAGDNVVVAAGHVVRIRTDVTTNIAAGVGITVQSGGLLIILSSGSLTVSGTATGLQVDGSMLIVSGGEMDVEAASDVVIDGLLDLWGTITWDANRTHSGQSGTIRTFGNGQAYYGGSGLSYLARGGGSNEVVL